MRSIMMPRSGGHRWLMEAGRETSFKILSSETSGSAAVFEEVVPAGSGTPLHIHHTSDELIYVRSGNFKVRTEEATATVEAGAWIFVPRGNRHGWRNVGLVPGELSFVFTPGSGAVCFEEFAERGFPLSDLPEVELLATFKRHGYELVSFDWD
jgi:quercetin dioxygenase-like cupin family protein